MKYLMIAVVLWMIVGCGEKKSSTVAAIPEASGIDYCNKSDTLVVVNDEGRIYEMRKDGEIVGEVKIKKYDFEGVVCTDKSFLVVVEDKGVLQVARDFSQTKFLSLKGLPKNLDLFEKKHGVEAIAKNGSTIYLSKQNKKSKTNIIVVLELVGDTLFYKQTLEHEIPDIAGAVYRDGALYMVSDQKDAMVVFDLKKSKITKRFKLGEFAQEGITFDDRGDIYFADDDGYVRKSNRTNFDF